MPHAVLNHLLFLTPQWMKERVEQIDQPFGSEERSLLSVAYKNVLCGQRTSWRIISSAEQKADPENSELAEEYRKTIEEEINNTCEELLVGLCEHRSILLMYNVMCVLPTYICRNYWTST